MLEYSIAVYESSFIFIWKKKKDMSSHNLADHNSGDLNATTVEQQMGPPEGILPKVQQMNFTDAHSMRGFI